jgi:hypothetical protein
MMWEGELFMYILAIGINATWNSTYRGMTFWDSSSARTSGRGWLDLAPRLRDFETVPSNSHDIVLHTRTLQLG